MKYSIIAEPVTNQLPLDKQAQFKKVFSDYNTSISVVVGQDKTLKLISKGKKQQDIQEGGKIEQNYMEVLIEEQMNWKSLKMIWCGSDQWVLLFQKPFQLYFIVNKYKKILPIKLNQDIDLTDISCYVAYPDLLIYGHEQKTFLNKIYSINLLNLETKEVTSNKDYSPKGRKGFWSLFSDSRLYVTGGRDKKQQPIDQLMWTLNIENGYWFALEFNQGNAEISDHSLSCQFENGKVLVIGKNGLSVVELYQSQAKQVEGWQDIVSPEALKQATNLFIWDGWLYLTVMESIWPKRFKINKIKASA